MGAGGFAEQGGDADDCAVVSGDAAGYIGV